MQKIVLKIDGMMCAKCEAHVNEAISKNMNVKKVTSSYINKETVILTEEMISEEKLRGVVKELGYEFIGLSIEPYEKRGFITSLLNR